MPSSKEIQQKRLKHSRTKRAYDAHIQRFMTWYAQHKGDYEDENGEEPIFKQSRLGQWYMNNSTAWCALMERRADTEEENAPLNPLFEYCTAP